MPSWSNTGYPAGSRSAKSPMRYGTAPTSSGSTPRLEDEYELKERVDALNRKLAVVSETADTLADIIDTRRSLRLELIVVVLIAFEVIITFYQIYAARGH